MTNTHIKKPVDLPEDLSQKANELERSAGQIDALQSSIEEKQVEVEKLKAEQLSLNDHLNKLKEQAAQVQREIAAINKQNFEGYSVIQEAEQKLAADRATLEKERSDFAAHVSSESVAISDAKNVNAERTQKLDERAETLRKRELAVDAYAAQVEEFKQRLLLIGMKRGGGKTPADVPELKD